MKRSCYKFSQRPTCMKTHAVAPSGRLGLGRPALLLARPASRPPNCLTTRNAGQTILPPTQLSQKLDGANLYSTGSEATWATSRLPLPTQTFEFVWLVASSKFYTRQG